MTAAQLALAWVLAQGKDIVAIPGTKRRSYLEQNAEAADIELSEHELSSWPNCRPLPVSATTRRE